MKKSAPAGSRGKLSAAQEDTSYSASEQTTLRRSGRKGMGVGGAADQLHKVSSAIEYKKKPLAMVDKTIFEDKFSESEVE
jgi:hypothetical protein